jgi:hypothetical protein
MIIELDGWQSRYSISSTKTIKDKEAKDEF